MDRRGVLKAVCWPLSDGAVEKSKAVKGEKLSVAKAIQTLTTCFF